MNSMGGFGGVKGPTGNIGNKTPSGTRVGQIAKFTPEQMQLFQQLFSNVGQDSFLSKLGAGDQDTFNQIEAPALRQFNELQGGLASRFSAGGGGRGAMSSRHSSGFQNAANAQASNFAQELQSNRQALQRQAIQDLMGISNDLLSKRPYETFGYEKQNKQGFNIGGLLGGAVGGIGGFFAGNPIGGAALGYGVGSSLGGKGGGGTDFSGLGGFGNFKNPFGNLSSQSNYSNLAANAAGGIFY